MGIEEPLQVRGKNGSAGPPVAALPHSTRRSRRRLSATTRGHMGAKDWMVFYADQDVPSVPRDRPTLNRQATNRLVERLFPGHAVSQLEDVSLLEGDPRDGNVHAAVWPGAAIVCSEELGVDRPSTVDRRFIEAGAGRTTYLHAMHSVVDWCAFAVWEPDGQLRRALSLSPDSGIVENVGPPLPFEEPFWAGDRPAIDPDDDDD